MKRFLIAILLIINIFTSNTHAQTHNLSSLRNLEMDCIESTLSNVFWGPAWEFIHYKVNDNALLYNQLQLKGNVEFNHRLYKNVTFAFDIERDKIIVFQASNLPGSQYIELPSSMVQKFEFTLQNHLFRFIHFCTQEETPGNLQKGFYEIVYQNELQLLRHYRKQYRYEKNQNSNFNTTQTLYLIKNGDLHKIKKSKDILTLFPNQKSDIKKFIRQNQIKITKANNQDLVPFIQYLENLEASI